MKKHLLLLLVCILGYMQGGYASHVMAADLTYKCIGPHRYQVTLNVYRDCRGVALNTTQLISYSSSQCGVNSTLNMTYTGFVEDTVLCNGQVSSCDGGSNSTIGIEKYTFTGVLNLPSGCGSDWVVSYNQCARNAAISTLNLAGSPSSCLYISATINNTLPQCDNSPQLSSLPSSGIPICCVGKVKNFSQSAYDPDGDSLVFVLLNARTTGGANMVYKPGLSANLPLYVTASGVVLDPHTGQLTFTPNQAQTGVISIGVYEYRNGVLIGHIERDLQVIAEACTDTSTPIVSPHPTNANSTANYTDTFFACVNRCITITLSDTNSVIETMTSTSDTTIPGSSFTIIPGNKQSGRFCWTPNKSDVGTVKTFSITAKANTCPVANFQSYVYRIVVADTNTAGPNKTVCQYYPIATSGLGVGTWTDIGNNPTTTTIVSPSLPATLITGFTVPGVYGYIWSSTYGCIDTMYVTVYAKPDAGIDQTICQYTTVTMNAVGNGLWVNSPSNPAVVKYSSATSPTAIASGFTVAGNYLLLWYTNGCPDTVVITVTTKPNAGNDTTICQYYPAKLNATGSGFWYILSSNPQATTLSNSNVTNPTVTGLDIPGKYGYVWTVNGCEDTMYVNVTAKPNAGADQSLCLPGSINTAGVGVGSWSAWSANPGTSVFSNPNLAITNINTFTGSGIFQYIWNVNGCTDTFALTVTPAYPAGPDQTICQFYPTSITAIGAGTWSIGNGNPALINIASPNTITSAVSGFTLPGKYAIVRTTATNCIDTVIINVTAKPNAGTDQTICQFTTATMNAVGVGGSWSALASNPAVVTFTPTNSASSVVKGFNVAGSYMLVWTLNGCTDTVKVTVTAKPNAGTDQTICQYKGLNLSGVGTGIWSRLSTNPAVVTFSDSSFNNTYVNGFNAAGAYQLVWTVNSCTDTMTVNTTAKPNAGTDIIVCQYATATMNPVGTGVWSQQAGDTSVLSITTPSLATTTVKGFTIPYPYHLIWTANGCTDTTQLIVHAKPDAGGDQSTCEFHPATAYGQGTGGLWHLYPANPTIATINNNIADTTGLDAFNAPGVYRFIWTINGCDDTMGVNVIPRPNAGTTHLVCQYTAADTQHAHGVGTWSAVTSNKTLLTFSNVNDSNATVSGFDSVAIYGLIWTVNGCSDTLYLNVTAKPNAGVDASICLPLTTANLNSVGSGNWTIMSTNPKATAVSNPTVNSISVTGMSIAGYYGYVWTVAGCTDTANITVIPQLPAGPDFTACQYSTVHAQGHAHGVWTPLASNPVATFISDSTDSVAGFSGFTVPGVYAYKWTVNGCTDTIFITIIHKPYAGADQSLCLPGTITTSATGGAGLWSVMSGNPGTSQFSDSTDSVNVLSNFSAGGFYHYIWTVNGCTDTVAMEIIPLTPAGPDDTVCQFYTATTGALSLGYWTISGGNPAPTVILHDSVPVTSISGFDIPGVYKYVWHANGCTDTFQVFVTPKPNAGGVQTICQFHNTTLSGVGKGKWRPLSGNPASIIFANDTIATTTVSGFTLPGTYLAEWTVNKCTDTAIIHVTPKPSAGGDQTICQYYPTSMSAVGTGVWSALSTNPSLALFAHIDSPNTIISKFDSAGDYNFVWTVNGCTDTMTVHVTPKPKAGADQTICQYDSATMTAAGVGIWAAFASNPATTSFSSNSSPTTLITGFTVAGKYSYVWTVNGCTDTVAIQVTPKPNAGNDITICQYQPATMSAVGSGLWSSMTGNPSPTVFAHVDSPNTVITGLDSAKDYFFIWTVAGCTDTVTIHVTPKPDAGADQTICQYYSTTMSAVGTGTWSSFATNPKAVTFSSLNAATATVSGFDSSGTYGFIWTTNSCPDTVLIHVTPKPNAGVDQTLCLPGSITMAAVGSGSWAALAANPTAVTITSPNSPTTTVSGFSNAGGNYAFEWTVNNCTDTMNVLVIPPSPAGIDQTICQFTTATMNAYGVGQWSIQSGNPTPVTFASIDSNNTVVSGFTLPGDYFLVWTIHGCADFVTIHVTSKPDAGIDQTICQFTKTNLAGIGAGAWTQLSTNPKPTTIADTTLGSSLVTGYDSSGVYGYVWTVNGCTDTVLVHVTPKPNAGIDQRICQYEIAHILASGSGQWTTIPSNPVSTTILNPTQASTDVSGFVSPGVFGYIWMVNGCPDTALVNVIVKPNAGADQLIPVGATATMGAVDVGVWSTLSTNPAIVSIADTTQDNTQVTGFTIEGKYGLIWRVNGCTDTAFITVLYPPDAGEDRSICLHDTLHMNSTQIGSWYSDPNNPTVVTFSSIDSPNATVFGFNQPGVYSFIKRYIGLQPDTMLVTVHDLPKVTTTLTPAICTTPTGVAAAVPTGGTAPYTYLWSTGATTDSITAQLYNYQYLVIVYDSFHCQARDSGVIGSQFHVLDVQSDSVVDMTCHDLVDGAVYLTYHKDYFYHWSTLTDTSIITNLHAGTYTVTVTDVTNCSGTASYTIVNPPAPSLRILPRDTTVSEDSSVNMSYVFAPYPQSSIVSYAWTPAVGLSCTNCANPVFSSSAATYLYTLVVTYNRGCKVTDTVTVIVRSRHILYVPNAFAPDGSNPDNTTYKLYMHGAKDYHLRIFDRWGEKVFESWDPDISWDGTYHGSASPAGTYVYDLNVTFNDGYSVDHKGSVTLLR